MKHGRALAAGVLGSMLGSCVFGCSSVAPGEASGAVARAIVAGEPSGAEQDGVVLLRGVLEEGEILCSAVLVGSNLIMTARHCVAYMSEGTYSCSRRGELIDNPTGGGRLGRDLPASGFEVYGRKTPRKLPLARGLRILSTLPPTVCQNDLAFVVLDTALDLPVVPMRLGRPAEQNEPAVLVGYGAAAHDQPVNYKTQARQQKTGLRVAAVGPDSIDDGVTTTVPPRVLIVEGPSGCTGDSGGPLLAESTGAVLGIYSLQRGADCSAPNVRNQLVHVPPFQTLIDEAFAAAGGEPVLEPTPGAGGANDQGGASSVPAGGAGAENAGAGAATAGAGGAAGDAANERDGTSPPPKSSGCSVSASPGDADTWRAVTLLALGALARRRTLARGRALTSPVERIGSGRLRGARCPRRRRCGGRR
jgi:MYXO-CTERM domain-containing protein